MLRQHCVGTGCKNLVAVVIDLDIIVRNKWVLVSVLGAETKQNFAYARPGGSVDGEQSKNGLNRLSVGWTCRCGAAQTGDTLLIV